MLGNSETFGIQHTYFAVPWFFTTTKTKGVAIFPGLDEHMHCIEYTLEARLTFNKKIV